MDIDTGMPFDPVRRDALLAILRDKGSTPTLFTKLYQDNDESIQRRYWPNLLRFAREVINGSWV